MLTRRIQVQTIADVLANQNGREHLSPERFYTPWREAYETILDAPPEERDQALREFAEGRQDGDTILGAVPGSKKEFQSLHDLAPSLRPVEWLWQWWVPREMITLLGASPGAGKSYVALDLARRVIEGDTFPDETSVSAADAKANVIYVDAEVVPVLINERVQAWGIDSRRFYLMYPRLGEMLDLGIREDQDRLIEMVYELDPSLVVVDSLSSINSKGENSVEDVRRVLSFLNVLANDYNCALLLIHHLRKQGALALSDVLTIDDFRGSSHIIAMSRSVLGLSVIQTGPEPDRNGPRRLESVKTNLGPYPEPIGVEFRPLHPIGVTLHYGAAPKEYKEPTKLDACIEWLKEILEETGEPMKPKEIIELGDEAGFCTVRPGARKMVDATNWQSLDLLSVVGADTQLKLVARKDGGEYASPSPTTPRSPPGWRRSSRSG